MPIIGKNSIEETKQKADNGRQSHQRIHIGSQAQSVFHTTHIEMTATDHHHHKRKQHHRPAMTGKSQPTHADSRQRQRNGPCSPHLATHLTIKRLLLLLLESNRIIFIIFDNHLKPSLSDGLADNLRIGRLRIPSDSERHRCKIDRSLSHALHLAGSLLDHTGTDGTHHPIDRKRPTLHLIILRHISKKLIPYKDTKK